MLSSGKLKEAGQSLGSSLPARKNSDKVLYFINTKNDLLKEPTNKVFTAMNEKYPEIECNIGKLNNVSILLDTGAEISCISLDFYQELKRINAIDHEIPVKNIFIKGATGVKSKRVGMQVFIPLQFGSPTTTDIEPMEVDGQLDLPLTLGKSSNENLNPILYSHFYVVDALAIPILIGSNWLYSQRSIIDLAERMLIFDLDKTVRHRVKFKNHSATNFSNKDTPEIVFSCDREVDTFYQQSPVDEFELEDYIDDADDFKLVDDDNYYLPTDAEFSEVVEACNLLNGEQKAQLFEFLLEFRCIFSQKPGLLKGFEYEIKAKPHDSLSQINYPVPIKYRDQVRDTIKIMQKWGIIERGRSDIINPLVVVIKSNGEVRLCLDGRKCNEIIIPDKEKTLPPDEIMQKFFGSTWLSSTDMSNSFWQIKLSESSKKIHRVYF